MIVAVVSGSVGKDTARATRPRPIMTEVLNSKHAVELTRSATTPRRAAISSRRPRCKVPSPTISSYCAGKGSSQNGGNAASVGHLYGLGNTEEKYRVKVFGCKERGRPRDGPLDHSTG